jgi:spore coat polysaccharide biosynthesis protein SpsF (cytidylyltransferase family)
MRAGIIIQARLTSSRFPNKMLCPLYGKPVLQWTIEACLKSGLPVVLAIPDKRTDWGIAEWLKLYDKDIKVYAGHPEDLVLRFKQVNAVTKFNPIIRICGDNPMLDHNDIALALALFEKRKKYVRLNLVEVFSDGELDYVADHDPFIPRREHCVNMLNQTVDYPEDIERIEAEWLMKHSSEFNIPKKEI